MCFGKLFFIYKFYLFDSKQSFFNGISLLGKFFISKLDVCIAEDKKIFFENHFYANISK